MSRIAIALILALGTTACFLSPDDCKKNETRACYCPGGKTSAQACSSDGTWGACVCGTPDAAIVTGPPDAP
jgi:hypothetical protein